MQENIPCWERFAKPEVEEHYLGSDETAYRYVCELEQKGVNIYRPEGNTITPEFLTEILSKFLSVCAHCTHCNSVPDSWHPPIGDKGNPFSYQAPHAQTGSATVSGDATRRFPNVLSWSGRNAERQTC